MEHVNFRYTSLGLLHLIWALLTGGILIVVSFAIYGTFVTNEFPLFLDMVRRTPFSWILGIVQLLTVLGLAAGMGIGIFQLGKKGAKQAAIVWLCILGLIIVGLFFLPIKDGGITVVKEGVFHHAYWVSGLEPYLMIVLMLLLNIVILFVVYRKRFSGMATTLFTGTIVWTMGFAAYMGLTYLDLGLLAVAGPVAILLAVVGFYLFKPIRTRSSSISKDWKRLKKLKENVTKTYPGMDMSTINSSFDEAKRSRTFASFSGVGYDRAMRKMNDCFQVIYDEVKKNFGERDLSTKPLLEAFGQVKALKKEDVQITELESMITKIEKALDKGKLDEAKEVARELKLKASDLKNVYSGSKDTLQRAEEVIARLKNLGAEDEEAEKNYEKAKKNFAKGMYDKTTMHAKKAAEEGADTADVYERAVNILNNLETRIHNKESHRFKTEEFENSILLAKMKLGLGGGSDE